MKVSLLLAATALALPLSASSAQITVEITEVPYTQPYAFLGVFFETGGSQKVIRTSDQAEIATPQSGFGVRMTSARDRDVQLELGVGYRKLDLSSTGAQSIGLTSFFLGGRFHPRKPQFGLGDNIGVRVTGAALGGYAFDMADTTYDGGNVGGLDISMTAGLVFSGRTDPSGLTAEFVYRPSTLTGVRYSVKPSWALRIGFLFGPG